MVAGVGGLYWAFPTLFFVIYYNTIYTTEFRVEDNKLHMSGMINAYTPEQRKDIFALLWGVGAAWVADRGG